MQRFSSTILALHLLLPILGVLALWRRGHRSSCASQTYGIVLVLNSLTALALCVLAVRLLGTDYYFIEWSLPILPEGAGAGLLSSLEFKLDPLFLPLLVLLPGLAWTSSRLSDDQDCDSPSMQTLLLVGTNLLIVANDLISLSLAATCSILSFVVLERQQSPGFGKEDFYPEQGALDGYRQQSAADSLTFQVLGWGSLFAGLAWIIACAAIVSAAPHGLPGMSTFKIDAAFQIINDSAEQHPAAHFVWQQYQLLPTAAVLTGVAFLGGIVPFHGGLLGVMATGSLSSRIWGLVMAKVALILLYRFLIQGDPVGWQGTAQLLTIPALLCLIYTSYLVFSQGDPARRFSRFFLWSQHVACFGFVLLPDSGPFVVMLSCCSHLAALVLLSLEQSRPQQDGSKFPIFIALLTLGLTPGATGSSFLWDASLHLTTADSLGAMKFVLFSIAWLVTLAGMLRYWKPLPEESSVDQGAIDFGVRRRLSLSWCVIAILSSFLIPVVIFAFRVFQSGLLVQP